MTTQYDAETHAALVRIIQRAAQRGRAIREQQTADLGELGGQTQDGGDTPDREAGTQGYDTPIAPVEQVERVRDDR